MTRPPICHCGEQKTAFTLATDDGPFLLTEACPACGESETRSMARRPEIARGVASPRFAAADAGYPASAAEASHRSAAA